MAGRAAPSIDALFAAGRLTPASSVRRLPGIGAMIETRLNGFNIYEIRDFVQHFNGMTLTEVREGLGALTQNQRANQCVVTQGPQARHFGRGVARGRGRGRGAAAANVRYHVRDVNMRGYNVLRDLLRFARLPANRDAFGAPRVRIPALPAAHTPTGEEAKYCGCLATRATCEVGNSCEWRSNRAAMAVYRAGYAARHGRRAPPLAALLKEGCVPRNEQQGFPGIGEFTGQHRGDFPHAVRPRGRYAGGWRIPGALAVVPV